MSVLVVTYTVQDGKSNYLEGAMLLGLYAIIALAFLVIPSNLVSGELQASEDASITHPAFSHAL